MTTNDLSADYYDCCEDREQLRHFDVDDAVEDYLDNLDPKDWPKEVEVWAWDRRVITPDHISGAAKTILEALIEEFDELQEFGNPDVGTKETTAMRVAARQFVQTVADEYKVWACEQRPDPIRVDTVRWVRANRQDWIDDDSAVVERLAENTAEEESP